MVITHPPISVLTKKGGRLYDVNLEKIIFTNLYLITSNFITADSSAFIFGCLSYPHGLELIPSNGFGWRSG